ncbi:recombinase family protein [Patescibacteria group bacterium]|nr:recombinase family protein [Patescibacteria group bacterium]
MKAIILARVSTEEQMTEGQSIPAQIGRAREYAKRKDFDMVKEYQFDESSTKDKRAKFEKVIEDIRKSKEAIALIVETVDRLQRSFKESVELDALRKEGKLELHFIRENLIVHKDSNSSEIQRWDLATFVAKSFVLQISDNVKRTFSNKVKLGEIIGRAPIGYLNVTDEITEKKDVIVDRVRAKYICKIFKLYSTGDCSMKYLSKLMNEEGLTTKKGKKLGVRQMELILKNPFYYGYQLYKGELYPHKYEPLISYELFLQCQKVKEGYKKIPRKVSEKPFVFQGLMTCANCGCRITPELKKGKYVYYHCTNHKEICEKIYVNQDDLLKEVKAVFSKLVLSDEEKDRLVNSLKATEEGKNEFQKMQLKELRKENDRIEEKISIMYEDRLSGSITIDFYNKKFKELMEKKQENEFKMKRLNNANKNYYITANTILSLAQRAPEIFESSETEEKRQLVNFVFQNLELDGKKLLFKTKTPFERVLEYQSTHNWGD